ncbi:hypothetical protein OH492_04835 [Vibrio chagasii]|nr:hypothetical protein [Vibrio chagasii]
MYLRNWRLALDSLVMDVSRLRCIHADLRSVLKNSRNLSLQYAGTARKIHVILTDMNQVLASSAGNAVLNRSSRSGSILTGEYRNPRLLEITMASCAEMVLGNLAKDSEEAREKLMAVLDNGKTARVLW